MDHCVYTRYCDDVSICNIPNFIEIAKHIYPKELELNETSLNKTSINFLDVHMEIRNQDIHIALYNKTDDYDFPITRYFKQSSNVPYNMPYGVLTGQILRIARITNSKTEFTDRIKQLYIEYTEKNNFDPIKTSKTIIKALHKYKQTVVRSLHIRSKQHYRHLLVQIKNSMTTV
jgi:uncharacterized protein (UPF0335 family)